MIPDFTMFYPHLLFIIYMNNYVGSFNCKDVLNITCTKSNLLLFNKLGFESYGD